MRSLLLDTVVWSSMAEKARRNVGMLYAVWRGVERASWSKILDSGTVTMKRMQRGREGEDLEGP